MFLKHGGLLCRHGVPHDYSSLEENNEKIYQTLKILKIKSKK